MERIGRIIRISGSLVVAEDIPSPQMYEVVEVGEERLIGEIIRISGNKSFIQVYETTSGIRPGDPVYATGSPLSAELGPGLIGQIYDGIQRPLSKIFEKTGSIYVRRGVKLPSLPRDIKYHFIPNEKISIGSEVGPGDVLGYVDETPLIRHPIIVPPDVRGRIIELYPEGDYTIEDPIAVIESSGEKKILRMLSRWPVRRPRSFKMKLEPTLPLITGMRIIDTLFPMAKGGTGAIPGAFGTGKCLLPGTPVLLANGRLVPIEKIFEKIKGGEPDLSLEEEIYGVGSREIYIYSFNGKKLVKTPISHVYRGKTDRIVKIKTRSGRIIKVTPVHRLIIFNERGEFVEMPAVSIRRGDLIVVPRRIQTDTKAIVNLYKHMPDAVVRDKKLLRRVIKIIRKLTGREYGGIKRLAEELGVKVDFVYSIFHGYLYPPLWFVEKLYKKIGRKPPHPMAISFKEGVSSDEKIIRASRIKLSIPREINGFFAYLLGMAYGNGRIVGKKSVKISIPFTEIEADHLKKLFIDTFGQDILREIRILWNGKDIFLRRSIIIMIDSRLLTILLKRLGIVTSYIFERKIPHIMFRASEEAVKYFLAGYFRVMGFYHDNKLHLIAVDDNAKETISYLLTRIGISYKVRKFLFPVNRKGGEFETYLLTIDRVYDLINFVEQVIEKDLLNTTKIVGVNTPINVIIERVRKLKNKITNYVPQEILSIPYEVIEMMNRGREIEITSEKGGVLQIMLSKYSVLSSDKLLKLAEIFREVTVDQVEKIEIEYGEWPVYDVTVPGTHNFVGGDLPTIYHNTVTLHSLAMWSDAKVVIYVGCGERGNEMTEVLERFPETKDPWTGRPLMERTILIANTSNMPVSAREASIYIGITLGEYYRDLGYDVLLVADSTSRWAEALREISNRLEEMPAEEGYPSYLQSRLAEFYERAGRVIALGNPERTGSVTVIGAVSPPGGDFTEPVTTHTRRFIRVFWALDATLAYSRHYPAINWITSYSAYTDLVSSWWSKEVDPSWRNVRDEVMNILLRENELKEVVRLIGVENLPEPDKLIMETARMIRDGFLRQNAYDPIDAFSSPQKQFKLLKLIMTFYRNAKPLVDSGVPVKVIKEKGQSLITEIIKARFTIRNEELEKLDELEKKVIDFFREFRGEKI